MAASRMTESLFTWSFSLRLFHVVLILSLVIAYIFSDEQTMLLHSWCGYIAALMLVWRIYMGLFGRGWEHFSKSHGSLPELFRRPADAVKASSLEYRGHTPPAALVMILILMALASTIISGMLSQGAMEFEGFFAPYLLDLDVRTARNILHWHEWSVNVLILLSAAHLGGVMKDQVLHKSRVALAMITGYKEQYVR